MLQQRPQQVGRRDIKDAEGAFEDLHVHITADTIEKVEAAVALIEPLLTPVDEDRNTHKRKQLRELAEMNGKVDCSLPLASLTS
jgi:splicing factor 1